MATYVQGPNDSLTYGHDWSEEDPAGWLGAGETIASAVTTVHPDIAGGVAFDSETNDTTTTTTHGVSGGVEGRVYRLTTKVTTSLPQVVERSHYIHIRSGS